MFRQRSFTCSTRVRHFNRPSVRPVIRHVERWKFLGPRERSAQIDR